MARRAVEALLVTCRDEPVEHLRRADRAPRHAARQLAESTARSRRDRRRDRTAARGRQRSPLPRARRAPPPDRRGGRRGSSTAAAARARRSRSSFSIASRTPSSSRTRPRRPSARRSSTRSPARAICTVSEPIGEGRAFADELRGGAPNVDLIDDGDAPAALDDATLFLLGADTVFRDGTLCNKIGTRRSPRPRAARGTPTSSPARS